MQEGVTVFGRRFDGFRIKNADPIVGLTPYIMPTRVDSQVFCPQQVNCDTLTNFLRQKRNEKLEYTYIDLIIAAFIRVLAKYPEMNRFVVNKQLYNRKYISVSMAVLKQTDDIKQEETTIKLEFDSSDLLAEVHQKLQKAIDENRKPSATNLTDRVAKTLLALPGIPTIVVGFAKLLDRYGLMPRFLYAASPFHTSLFLTNMASIGMPYVYHHIYNFGTTSIFLSMGKVEKIPTAGPGGTLVYKRMLPLGVTLDERITEGSTFGLAFGLFRDLLAHPERLEIPD